MHTCNTSLLATLTHTDSFELKCFLPVFLNSKHLRSAFNLSEFLVTEAGLNHG